MDLVIPEWRGIRIQSEIRTDTYKSDNRSLCGGTLRAEAFENLGSLCKVPNVRQGVKQGSAIRGLVKRKNIPPVEKMPTFFPLVPTPGPG